MVNYLLLVISISLAIAGQILMKQGMLVIGKFPVKELLTMLIPMLLQPFVFLGISCFAVSSVFWLVVLSRIQLSYAYPLVSVGYIVVSIYSYYFLGESLSFIRWMGMITICLGVILVSRS